MVQHNASEAGIRITPRREIAVRTVAGTPAPEVRPLRVIACEIYADWPAVRIMDATTAQHPAAPYWNAMLQLDKITDKYYEDSAKSVVLYFLSNASTWRGETARRIKAELKGMVK